MLARRPGLRHNVCRQRAALADAEFGALQSALEAFRVETVGDLAALDTGRLSRFAGIVDATKREIRGRAKAVRAEVRFVIVLNEAFAEK